MRCESCEKRRATKVVVLDGVMFEVCEDCVVIVPERALVATP